MKNFACWTAADARALLATEALEGGESRFLATHLPITGFEIEGSAATDVEARDQAGLLRALNLPGLRHAFCAVEGEPGSGKSHLIRWLRVMWPHESDLVLLIQRADGSLDGTLQQLRERLPAEYVGSLEVLGNVQQVGERGRWHNFLSILANSLAPGYFAGETREDESWCAERRLKDLFGSTVVAERWTAHTRILSLASGKGGERNSEVFSFTTSDVLELVGFAHDIKNVPIAATTLLRRLSKEREAIRSSFGSVDAMASSDTELATKAPETVGIVRALNSRLNHALQFFIGIGKDKLRDLFLQLRKRLRVSGRRLVLLLEDITSFQGVDDQLIDALVTQANTREQDDLCDLISVVGITPKWFRDNLSAYGNYRGRITHHIRLGQVTGTAHQDVAMLRDTDGSVAFAARYLRAVRAGMTNIDAWHASNRARLNEPEPVPNRCLGCPHRPACHSTFGTYDGVGLYPFTSEALRKMFESLRDSGQGMTLRTPRGLIQNILTPTLMHPTSIERGRYPGPELEVAPLQSARDENLEQRQSDLIKSLALDDEDRARVLRLVAWWGSSSASPTGTANDGSPAFFAVPSGVFAAFDAPWPGLTQNPPPQEAEPEDDRSTSVDRSDGRTATPRPGPRMQAPTMQPATDPTPGDGDAVSAGRGPRMARSQKSVPKSLRLAQLEDWSKGKRLEDHSYWQEQIPRLIDDLPWHVLDFSPVDIERMLPAERFVFEGSQQTRGLTFVLTRQQWLVDGLRASVELQAGGIKDAGWRDVLERRYARLLRRLGDELQQYLQKHRVRSQAGEPWSVEGAMTALLLSRAWLRGTCTPDDPPAEQWKDILSADTPSVSAPKSRTEKWSEILGLMQSHENIREALHAATRLRLPSRVSDDDALVFHDASEPARVLLAVSQGWNFPPMPATDTKGLPGIIATVVTDFSRTVPTFEGIPSKEVARLRQQAQDIEELRHDYSVMERKRRLLAVCTEFAKIAPLVAPVQVTEFTRVEQEWQHFLTNSSVREADVGKIVREFLEQAKLRANPPPSPAASLAWALSVRADVLNQLLNTLRIGDRTVRLLLERAQHIVSTERGASAGTSVVKELGMRIQVAVTAIRETVGDLNE